MEKSASLLNLWVQENNAIVNKLKQWDSDNLHRDQIQARIKSCYLEIHKLLRKIQGIPVEVTYVQLELTVVYNACVFSLNQTELAEAEQLLTKGLERVSEVVGCKTAPPGSTVFWHTVLESLGNSTLRACFFQLLCLQWAVWLATCSLESIQELQEELLSVPAGLCVGEGEVRMSGANPPEEPLVVLDPRELRDLLHTCSRIAQGAEWLSEGRCTEALSLLQRGSTLPAPRALLAKAHFLSGVCLGRTGRPHSALQCYRKSLETDPRCVCALHRSALLYRQLGNPAAEIQALQLLYSSLLLPTVTESVTAGSPLLGYTTLLRVRSLSGLLTVPSPLSVLHSLARTSVLHGRVSEGVDCYLDLLASLQPDHQPAVCVTDPLLPGMTELYLEAGSALLMAQQPADCLALCDEVIGATLELLPDRLLLEEPGEEGSPGGLASDHGGLSQLLWTAGAYLLQGHGQLQLKDWKQAVAHYTRCTNLLVRVRVKMKDNQSQPPFVDLANGTPRGEGKLAGLWDLQRLKGLALAGRGVSFLQRGQLREALRDLQLSQVAAPGSAGAGLWLGEVLWRLGRGQEAAACWDKASVSSREHSTEDLPLWLHAPQTGPFLDLTDIHRRMKELLTPTAREALDKA
ncbi:Fanconi anemia group G protein [Aplochiton taeniatus]